MITTIMTIRMTMRMTVRNVRTQLLTYTASLSRTALRSNAGRQALQGLRAKRANNI